MIPPEFALKFERFASSLFSSDANTCSQFLRHKANIISPNLLLKNDIKVHKIIHRQGEIMITYPKSYHQGFNLGFNCAESVNFATRDWIPHGLTAKYCSCIPDSVRLDVKGLFSDIDTLILHTRDFASNVNNELILYGGRKQAIVQKSVKSKSKPVVLKITIPKGPHCALCTDFNDVTLIKTDSLNKFVHLHCAQGIPECTVKDSICINFNLIPKSRFSLKCDYCKTKHGACIQCFKGKCKRSYHVSCALIHLNYKYNSELDMGESYCSQHDSANILERKRKLEIINNEIALIDFQVGKLVIVKAKSFSYQGIVEELNAELQNCIVGFNGASFTIDWKNLSKFSAPERIEQVETVYKQNKVIKRVKKVSEEDDGEMEKDGCDAVDGLIVCPKVV